MSAVSVTGCGEGRVERREILFLQGPPGRFFHDLALGLRARGHGVHRVNFNGGDRLDWRGRAVDYRGGAGGWPGFLARLLIARGVTDVVLFGDCRPIHRAARAVAGGMGLAVHVFEEGYIRPDWVTLERGGVNGFSALPADPQWYLQAVRHLDPCPDRPTLPSAIGHRGRAGVAYYLAAFLAAPAYPGYRTHRPWLPALEALGWVRQAVARRLLRRRDPAPGPSYFLLPLQLDSDYQLRTHSDFEGMQPALAQVIVSFARHAPPDAQLAVKRHPLDNGLRDWRRRTLDFARALGVAGRVLFLEAGDIDPLVGGARGVVTVNSTTGALALAAGVPVVTLGRAVYDIPGLTHQGSLDTFWRTPERPDLRLYEAFRRVLAARCLLWGGFYASQTRTLLVESAADRILGGVHVAAAGADLPAEPCMMAAE
ncbi:capsule biosynthesis protein [Caulobacter endophyticus]|uniref:capsule biosynthesis protein n=1 Tax=Caulobacter endophyticus TaxID=2172652 RepID=UPI0024107AF0|nr:capsular biosynthesis protein [Caulobacter endophyticus]MDG2527247.1 capsular biosynthesis protein [Caulobacter endophyticus]